MMHKVSLTRDDLNRGYVSTEDCLDAVTQWLEEYTESKEKLCTVANNYKKNTRTEKKTGIAKPKKQMGWLVGWFMAYQPFSGHLTPN